MIMTIYLNKLKITNIWRAHKNSEKKIQINSYGSKLNKLMWEISHNCIVCVMKPMKRQTEYTNTLKNEFGSLSKRVIRTIHYKLH